MNRTLRNRITKLERFTAGPGQNRVLHYDPLASLKGRAPRRWFRGQGQAAQGPSSVRFQALAGRYMLASDFGSDADWEAAAARQQAALLHPP